MLISGWLRNAACVGGYNRVRGTPAAPAGRRLQTLARAEETRKAHSTNRGCLVVPQVTRPWRRRAALSLPAPIPTRTPRSRRRKARCSSTGALRASAWRRSPSWRRTLSPSQRGGRATIQGNWRSSLAPARPCPGSSSASTAPRVSRRTDKSVVWRSIGSRAEDGKGSWGPLPRWDASKADRGWFLLISLIRPRLVEPYRVRKTGFFSRQNSARLKKWSSPDLVFG
jgi:hypothetical protein